MIPGGSFSFPSNMYVFPTPDWPKTKIFPVIPSRADSTIGFAILSKIATFDVEGLKTVSEISKDNDQSNIHIPSKENILFFLQ